MPVSKLQALNGQGGYRKTTHNHIAWILRILISLSSVFKSLNFTFSFASMVNRYSHYYCVTHQVQQRMRSFYIHHRWKRFLGIIWQSWQNAIGEGFVQLTCTKWITSNARNDWTGGRKWICCIGIWLAKWVSACHRASFWYTERCHLKPVLL